MSLQNRAWPAFIVLGLFTASACAQSGVTIDGRVDGSGQNYSWKVSNTGPATIVWIEFPHYHADMFTPPNGWDQNCTNLQNLGQGNKPGVCQATAPSPDRGIAPGASATFEMRIARIGANRGRGTVHVKFADGSETHIADVVVPVETSLLERSMVPVAMGAILLLALYAHQKKKRKKPAAASAPMEST